MKDFISDVFRVGLSKIAIIIFSLTQSIIGARWLGPENTGLISAITIYPSIFMTFGSLGIRQATAYFVGKGIFNLEDVKRAIIQIWIFTTSLSLIICFILITKFSSSGDSLKLVLLALAPIPFTLFNTYNSGLFLGKNDIKGFNKINWIPPFIVMLSSILLVIIFNLGVAGFMIGSISGSLIMTIILLYRNKFLQAFSFRVNFVIIKRMLGLGITYAIALVVINLNYKVDVIILDKLSTPYEIGIYSKGANIIQYLWEIPMLLSTIIFARSATSKNGQEFSYKVIHLLRVSIIIVGLGCIILFFISKFLMVAMFGKEFEASSTVLKALVPGVLLLTIFKVLNMDLAGKGKPWISMKAMVPALIINVIFNYILVPNYGSVGSALASTISYSTSAILFLYFYCKEVGIPMTYIFKFSKNDFMPIIVAIKKMREKKTLN